MYLPPGLQGLIGHMGHIAKPLSFSMLAPAAQCNLFIGTPGFSCGKMSTRGFHEIIAGGREWREALRLQKNNFIQLFAAFLDRQ